MTMATPGAPTDARFRIPDRAPALVLGVGLGGFVDGIVVHQLLQWHHMISDTHGHPVTTVAGLRANTLADGLFHSFTWVVVVVGVVLTIVSWRRGRLAPTWRFQIGLLVAGWGAFNLVEGVVDHQILGIHHVRDDLGGPLSWDLGFLAVSAALLVGGWTWQLSGLRELTTRNARADVGELPQRR
ncbi:DUF2243 domain-containing protein [Cellulomonas sp. URHD0024]|uniref:DUF2243 domain-containing protein n=1 Tax=Cellulomonas sp. URHD0024 TaxID=1302620 RepID=UPI00040323A7|nr:DUF2243 domain-containing protein [Cellulomonas sp. URHD0024]